MHGGDTEKVLESVERWIFAFGLKQEVRRKKSGMRGLSREGALV